MGKKKTRIRVIGVGILLSLLVALGLWNYVQYTKEKPAKTADKIAKLTAGYDYSNQDNAYFSKTLMVKAEEKVSDDTAIEVLSCDGLFIFHYQTEEDTEQAYKIFQKNPAVKQLEVDRAVKMSAEEGQKQEMQKSVSTGMAVESMYTDLEVTSNDLLVAVVDTGYDMEHMGNARIVDSALNYSSSGKPGSIQDDHGHGTQMASIILANTNACVKILPVKALNQDGMGSILSVYSAIKYAITQKVAVINLSMVSFQAFDSPLLKGVIKEAKQQGIFVVVSAGNQGIDLQNQAPANVEEAIVVSAINSDLTRSSYSNYGQGVDFCSYGTTKAFGLNQEVLEVSGTSTAAAIVSAVIANCKILNNAYTYDEVYQVLLDYAVDLGEVGYDTSFGNGALALTTVTGLYESIPCETAAIFTCDWKSMSDEELDRLLESTPEVDLSLFLQRLSKKEQKQLFSRDTILTKERLSAKYDPNGNRIATERDVYYQYLLEQDIAVQSNALTKFGRTLGYFYLYVYQDGQEIVNNARIYVRLRNVSAWTDYWGSMSEWGLDKDMEVELTVQGSDYNNKGFIDFPEKQPEIKRDEVPAGGYYNFHTELYLKQIPAHYNVNEIHTISEFIDSSGNQQKWLDSSGLLGLADEEMNSYGHRTTTGNLKFSLALNSNACGLTWWGAGQAGPGNQNANNSSVIHTTAKIYLTKSYEKLKINPKAGEWNGSTATQEFLQQCTTTKTIDNPVRFGYTFHGWQVSHANSRCHGSLSNQTYTFEGRGRTKELAETTTLTAQWSPNIYKISLDDTGGTGGSGQIYEKYTVGYYLDAVCTNKQLTTAQNPVSIPQKAGYQFQGYYTAKGGLGKKILDGRGYLVSGINSLRFQEDSTLYAYWEPEVYTITLDDNGGSGGSGAIYEKYGVGFYKNNSCTNLISANNPVNIPTKEGYDFLGYYKSVALSPSDTPKIQSNGKLASNMTNKTYTGNATLYAQWKVKVYTIQYHSNYQDTDLTEQSSLDTKKHGIDFILPTLEKASGNKIWTKKDYHFVGWSTNKNAKAAEYQPGDIFVKNEDTDLYAVWEKNILEIEVEAPKEDNPEQYYDYSGSLKSDNCDGVWYKDCVTVKATGSCNYAAIKNVYLSNPLNNDEFDYQGPDGQDWYMWTYGLMDVDQDGVTDEAVTVKGYVIDEIGNTVDKEKLYYIDYDSPGIHAFTRTFDRHTGTYTVFMDTWDEQSGITEVILQSQDASGNWTDIHKIDYRVYDESVEKETALAEGRYTTVKEWVTGKFDNLPVNTANYNQLYRLTSRDAVGHESYSDIFTLAPELKIKTSIRKIDGTSALAGEELELYQYGDMRCWIDVTTEGYAEQLLYILPSYMHLYPGYGSYTQLTEASQLDGLPMKDSDKSKYQNYFDNYNFYLIPTANDPGGQASDIFQLEIDESRLELKKVYNINVYALRGVDYKNSIPKIKYIHKKIGHRVIFDQSWQAPVFVKWNGFFSFLNKFDKNVTEE